MSAGDATVAAPRSTAKTTCGRVIDRLLQEDAPIHDIAACIRGEAAASSSPSELEDFVASFYNDVESGKPADAEAFNRLNALFEGIRATSLGQRSLDDRKFRGTTPEHKIVNDLIEAGVTVSVIGLAIGYGSPTRQHIERFLSGQSRYLGWRQASLYRYYHAQVGTILSDSRAPLVAFVDFSRGMYPVIVREMDYMFAAIKELETERSVGTSPKSATDENNGYDSDEQPTIPMPAFRCFNLDETEAIAAHRSRIYLHLLIFDVALGGGGSSKSALDAAVSQWKAAVLAAPTDENWAVMLVHSNLPPNVVQARSSRKTSRFGFTPFKTDIEKAEDTVSKLLAYGESRYTGHVFTCIWGTERTAVMTVTQMIQNCFEWRDHTLSRRSSELSALATSPGFSLGEYWQILEERALNLLRFGLVENAFGIVTEAVTMGQKTLLPVRSKKGSLDSPGRTPPPVSERDWQTPLKGFDLIRIAGYYQGSCNTEQFAEENAQLALQRLNDEARLLISPWQFGIARGEDFQNASSLSSLLYWIGFGIVIMLQTGNRRGAFEYFLGHCGLLYNVMIQNGALSCDALLLLYLTSIGVKRLMKLVRTLNKFASRDSSANVFAWVRFLPERGNGCTSVGCSNTFMGTVTVAPDLATDGGEARLEPSEVQALAEALDRSNVYMLIRDIFMMLAKSCGYDVTTLAMMTTSGIQIPGMTVNLATIAVDATAATRVMQAVPDLADIDSVRHKFCQLTLAAADACSKGSRARWDALLRCEVARAYKHFDPRRGVEVLTEAVGSSLLSVGQWPSLTLHARRLLFMCLVEDRRRSPPPPEKALEQWQHFAAAGLTLISMTPHHNEKLSVWKAINHAFADAGDADLQTFGWNMLLTPPDVSAHAYSLDAVDPGSNISSYHIARMHVDQIAVLRVVFMSHFPIDPSLAHIDMRLVSKSSWADNTMPENASMLSFNNTQTVAGRLCRPQSMPSIESDSSPGPRQPSQQTGPVLLDVTHVGDSEEDAPSDGLRSDTVDTEHYVSITDGALNVTDTDAANGKVWRAVAIFALPICHFGVYRADSITLTQEAISLHLSFEPDTAEDVVCGGGTSGAMAQRTSPAILDVPDPSAKTVALRCEPVLGAHFFADPRSPFALMNVEACVTDAVQNTAQAQAWFQKHPSCAACSKSAASFRISSSSGSRRPQRPKDDEGVVGRFVISNTATGPSRELVLQLLKRLAYREAPSSTSGMSKNAGLRRMQSRFVSAEPQASSSTQGPTVLAVFPHGQSGPKITLPLVDRTEVAHLDVGGRLPLAPKVAKDLTGASVTYKQVFGVISGVPNQPSHELSHSPPPTPKVTRNGSAISSESLALGHSVPIGASSFLGGASFVGGHSLISNMATLTPAETSAANAEPKSVTCDVVTKWERLANDYFSDMTAQRYAHHPRGDTHLFTCRKLYPHGEEIDVMCSDATPRGVTATEMRLCFNIPLAAECFALQQEADEDPSSSQPPPLTSTNGAHSMDYQSESELDVSAPHANVLRISFGLCGVQGFRHAELLVAVHISPAFEVDMVYKPVHDVVYCFARITNILSDTPLWIDGSSVRLILLEPVAHVITRSGSRNLECCEHPLLSGDRIILHFELEELESLERALAKQRIRLMFDYCHADLAPQVAGQIDGHDEPRRPIFNRFTSAISEFACAHARPFSIKTRAAPPRLRGAAAADIAAGPVSLHTPYAVLEPIRLYIDVHAHRRAWSAHDPRFEQPVYVIVSCNDTDGLGGKSNPAYQIVGRVRSAIRFSGPGICVGPLEVTLIPLRPGTFQLPRITLQQASSRLSTSYVDIPCELSYVDNYISVQDLP